MKKIKFMALALTCVLALAACGSNGGSNLSASDDISASEPISDDSTRPQTKAPSKGEDNNAAAELTENDAFQLVTEQAPDLSVSVEESITQDGRSYYLYLVQDATTGISTQYAVDTESGEVALYTEDGQILNDMTSSPFYDAQLNAECDWNGTFTRQGNDATTMELAQGDPQSFEFSLNSSSASLFGVAYIHGNLASFHDEEAGISLDFVMNESDNTITVTGNPDYSGVYALS